MSYKSLQKKNPEKIQINCAVCGSSHYTPLFYVSQKRIVRCSKCDHEYVNPIPNQKNIVECLFSSNRDRSIATKIDITYLAKIFDKYSVRKGKLLDLGCGEGRLEKELIRLDWAPRNLYLMDNSERSIRVTRKKYPSSIFICGDAQEKIGFNDYFDCILMVEFLEHLSNPKKALQNALEALKQRGVLIIRGLPNNMSLEAYIGQKRWKMRQFAHHYHFFNHRTFSILAKNLSSAYILEFGVFLQEGFRFYDIAKIAKNLGVIKNSEGKQYITYDDNLVELDEIADLVLARIRNIDFKKYKYISKLDVGQINFLSSAKDIEDFFNSISLDPILSPDFSVVIRKGKII